jgi:mannose-1-phosphate guanylyltransferase
MANHDCAMSDRGHRWALVLAAGEGSRLRTLTTTAEGVAIPKQFCSLRGAQSLLSDALHRAGHIAHDERICTVVAAEHRPWWQVTLASRTPASIVAQVRNKGTAIGILLPLLRILARDPDACIAVLPSDHFVARERVLTAALSEAMSRAARGADDLILLGIKPDEFDAELGYIVPASRLGGSCVPVRSFVEKPDSATAAQLIEEGALWNAFIMAVRGRQLLNRFLALCPDVVARVQEIALLDPFEPQQRQRIEAVYERLPTLDFSRDLLQRDPAQLSVMRVSACGWSDLGTPQRVAQVLARAEAKQQERVWKTRSCAFLELSRCFG